MAAMRRPAVRNTGSPDDWEQREERQYVSSILIRAARLRAGRHPPDPRCSGRDVNHWHTGGSWACQLSWSPGEGHRSRELARLSRESRFAGQLACHRDRQTLAPETEGAPIAALTGSLAAQPLSLRRAIAWR